MDPLVAAGTRPEIIKMAPIIRAFKKKGIPSTFVYCGQHYDYNMSQQFIEDLELAEPDYTFKVKAKSQGAQTAQIVIDMERLMQDNRPQTVLVEGDTNSVLATALAAAKLHVPVGHVEAGLRSFDLRMPEEHNRRLTDHLSTFLFAPTKVSAYNLERENVWGKIFVTGNTVIDACMQHMPIAERKSRILQSVSFGEFILATAHRAENVDDPRVLNDFMETFTQAPIPVVYPMHPRTKKRLKQSKVLKKLQKSKNVLILPPLGYLDFLMLMKKCTFIITDSGGIQEEATAPCISKRVLVIRVSTERPEAVEAGFAEVVGTERQRIKAAMKRALEKPGKVPDASPYGDGTAAEKIVEITLRELDS